LEILKGVKTAFMQNGWSPGQVWKPASPELETQAVCSSETCCIVNGSVWRELRVFCSKGKRQTEGV